MLREKVDEAARFLFVSDDALVYEPDAIDKVLKKNDGQGLTVVRDLREVLAGVGDWNHTAIEQAIQKYCELKQPWPGKSCAADSRRGVGWDDQPADLSEFGVSRQGANA